MNHSTNSKNYLLVALLFCFFGNDLFAQEEKPELDFEVQINSTEEKLEVTWFSCLENSIITLMDNSQRPLKVQALCQDNGNIDISDLESDVYYVKVEHYTGEGMKSIVKDYETDEAATSSNLSTPSSLEFETYPNPAKNTITVALEDCLEKSTVSIIDIHGRILQSQIMSNNQDDIDISNLAKGVYFIRIEHNTGLGIQRIVKN